MCTTRHYVPILRWKQAEKLALHRLRIDDKIKMTPLIELTPAPFLPKRREASTDDDNKSKLLVVTDPTPDPGSVLRRHAKEVLRFWGYSPFFLEVRHLEGTVPLINGKTHCLAFFAELARNYRLKLVPVTGLNPSITHQSAIAEALNSDNNGLCLRVNVAELLDKGFANRSANSLKTFGTSIANSDLLIDYGVFNAEATGIFDLISMVPDVASWRSVIVAQGAFPKDLQGFKPGAHRIERSDWKTWVSGLAACGELRWPSFSDYTIQYGQYVEPVENANPSASIRYTLENEWLIMRGEGIFNEDGPGRAQWNANAILLTERDEFYGANFCDGDTYIAEMSRDKKNHGSPMTWIRAGLNHHMSVVLQQIGAL
jgi:hypothetical protein